MSQIRNGAVPRASGLMPPSGARRVLALGYYDGPTAGVLEADTGDEYRFELTDEEHQLSRRGKDGWMFSFRLLPAGSLDELVRIIGPHSAPKWPVWVPGWHFADAATQSTVETLTDSVLDRAGPVAWEISASDRELTRFTAKAATEIPTTRS